MEKLFRLLSQYYPSAKQLRDPKVQLAWVLALKPFPYDDIKAAAIEYAGRGKYFPDIADLTKRCSAQNAMVAQRTDVGPRLIQDVKRLEADKPTMDEMLSLMDQDYISAGVPHPSAARKMGWTLEKWVQVCRAKLEETVAGPVSGLQ